MIISALLFVFSGCSFQEEAPQGTCSLVCDGNLIAESNGSSMDCKRWRRVGEEKKFYMLPNLQVFRPLDDKTCKLIFHSNQTVEEALHPIDKQTKKD